MPTKLSNFNFFILKDRYSSVSRPLRIGGILRCYLRVDPHSLLREDWTIATCGLKRCTRGQIFFNPIDQLGNIDRLGDKWMPSDAEASFRLGFRD